MKVLVTGADGFIGSHLVEMLVALGHDVRALAQYNSFNDWGWLEQVSCREDIEIICGDIRDAYFCQSLCQGIDWVFHLAALIAIPYSYQAAQSYVDTNVVGSMNMARAALDQGVSRFIHTSTSEVYGSAQYVPIDELHPLQPQSPYSASKIAADAMVMSFHHAFELPLVIARPFNTYGPRQSARAVIPTIIAQILTGVAQIKLGDTSPTRDFNFVKDTCRGFIALADAEKACGEIINIGSGEEISVLDTLQLIRELMGSEVEFICDKQRLRPENSEVSRLCCEPKKIFNLTGFKSNYLLRDGLIKTIDWFSDPKNLSRYKADIYNV